MKPFIQALVFDVYGTLFDVYSVKEKCRELYGDKGKEISNIWRQKQLQYSFLRQLMGQYEPFSQITQDALKYTLTKLELPYEETKARILLEAYRNLQLHPETEEVLAQMQDKKIAVFSNGSRDMLEPLINNSKLSGKIDDIISVDDIKQYKPTPASYSYALKVLGVERHEVLFMSSNEWDIAGAKSFGFQTAWINRDRLPLDKLGMEPDSIYPDLTGILEWR